MFTGIIQGVGRIVESLARGDGVRVTVDAGALDIADVAVGDSVAVNGCCLTAVIKNENTLAFDVSAETLACTSGFERSGSVNLEKALRLCDRLGGHLVSGHVDGVGTVVAFAPVAQAVAHGDAGGESWRLEIEAPADLARFIAAKGSIAVQGVSFTVNGVDGARFDVNLIQHTLAVTTLKSLLPGARVNIEVDMIARYVERIVNWPPRVTLR